MYDVERYLSIRSAYGASFAHDGESLSFLLDTTGVPQVWTTSGANQWPTQGTAEEERISFASQSPERPELIFGMDEGGNERAQFFRLDTDDGNISPLTERPDAKHQWGSWSNDGERFAFSSNRRDESVFDIYVQERTATGEDARLVYEGDGWFTAGEFCPDDERLVVLEAHSSYDQDVHVLDLETGQLDHLTPHDEPERYQSITWGPDGDVLYLVTDRDADTLYLAVVDVKTGKFRTVVEGGEWNVEGVGVHQESGRIVYARNVDGYTELHAGALADRASIEQYPSPAIPDGVAGGISFDPDGERFAVTTTSRTRNTNVGVATLETGEYERWTDASTAGIPTSTFRAPELVHVDSFDDLAVPGFFTVPADAKPGDTPVIVDIHGGPESQRRPSFSSLTQYFLAHGYAVFEPNVRGSSGYGKRYTHLDDVERRMDSVRDLKACVEWLREQEVVDPDRIVAKGGSYGGFMVLAGLTEYPDLWAAGVNIVGIANFVTFLENTGAWRRSLREAEYGSLEEDREFLESISPINRVERIRAPLFVVHGENDPRVPVGEAEQIAAEASDHVPVETLIFEDEGHGLAKLENQIEAYRRIVDFLDEHV